MNINDMSLTEKVSRRHESSPFQLPHNAHKEVKLSKNAHSTGHCSPLNVETKNVHSACEKRKEYKSSGEQKKLIVKDEILSGEEAAHVEVKTSGEVNGNPSSILRQNQHFLSQPNMKPVWRGSFSICNGNNGKVEGLIAYVSSKVCSKVSAVATSMPASLCGELLHRHDVWPKGFNKSPPTDGDIALYFFPENERDEKLYDSLLDYLIDQKYAMKAVVGRAELLVFTSHELPEEHWRFQKKYYLWGLFKTKKASPPHQADDHLHNKHVSTKRTKHLLSASDVGTGEESNLTKALDTWSPMSPLNDIGERQGMERMKDKSPTHVQLKLYHSQSPHCTNVKSKEHHRNPSMYLKKKVVSETGPGVGASKQDAEKNLDQTDSIQVEKTVEQSPKERTVNGALTEAKTNETIAEETTEITAPAGATHHEADIVKQSVTVKREPKDIAEKENDKDNPGDVPVNAAVAIQAQLVTERTDTIANRSTEIVSSNDAIHPEDNVNKRNVKVERETEAIAELPMDIDTPDPFVRNTNFVSDGSAEVGAPVGTNHHEEHINIRSVTMEKGPEGISENESPFPDHISVNSGAKEMFSGNTNIVSNTVGAILLKDIGTSTDRASMNEGERQGMERMKDKSPTHVQLKLYHSQSPHCTNMKSKEHHRNPSMYLKKKVVSETGPGVGASKQDAEKNLDQTDSIQVEKTVEQSPEERTVNGAFTEAKTNETIAEETTEITAPAGATHHEADIIKQSVTVKREPKDIAEKENDKDNPGDVPVNAAVAIQAQLVTERTDTIANRSTEIVSSNDAIHPEDNVNKRNVKVERETEAIAELPMDIDTPDPFVRNTNFVSDGSAEVRAPVDTNHREEDINIRNVTMEKVPEGISENESPFPEHVSVNSGAKEMFSGNTNTISNAVGAILLKDIGTSTDRASMNKDVELDQTDHLIEVQKEFEQPPRGQIVNEGLTEMENCRTIADVSTEHCAHSGANYYEKDKARSVPVEEEHKGINESGSDRNFPRNIVINAGPMQDGSSIINTDTINSSVTAIPPHEINQAIDEDSIGKVDLQVHMVPSIERPEQTAMNVFEALLLENRPNATEHNQLGNQNIHAIPSLCNPQCSEELVGEGPQVGMVESAPAPAPAPDTTVHIAVSSYLASEPDVQETTNVTQPQGADQGTMLHRYREEKASSCSQFGNHSIGTSMYNMADAFHGMDLDETESADNSVALVGPYRVNSDVAPILQTIIDKHGDIAQDCQLRSVSMRSRMLEGLCMELQIIQSLTSTNLRSHHLESLDSAISDAENAKLNIKWLRCWHNQLKGFIDLLQQYKNLKDDFTKSKEMANSKKRTLDTKKADLRKTQSDIELLQSQLASLEAEGETLGSSVRNYRSKCRRLFGKSLAEGLL